VCFLVKDCTAAVSEKAVSCRLGVFFGKELYCRRFGGNSFMSVRCVFLVKDCTAAVSEKALSCRLGVFFG